MANLASTEMNQERWKEERKLNAHTCKAEGYDDGAIRVTEITIRLKEVSPHSLKSPIIKTSIGPGSNIWRRHLHA